MVSEKLNNIIEQDLEIKQLKSWHGITKENIKDLLVAPISKKYVTAWD